MSTNQLDKLHEFDFWSMINNIKWGDCTTKCIAAKRYIMHNFPPYKTNVFRRIADNYTCQLVEKYMNDLSTTFSYTEVYNGAYEVISQGKTSYDSYFNKPSLLTPIIEYIISKDEDEKFVYAMPLEDDFFNQDII
jgi:hypothetical protein